MYLVLISENHMNNKQRKIFGCCIGNSFNMVQGEGTKCIHYNMNSYDLPSSLSFRFVMQVRGTDYKTTDGTCIRDYIDVTDLVDAHVKALEKSRPGKVGIYNVGTGRGKTFFLVSLYSVSPIDV